MKFYAPKVLDEALALLQELKDETVVLLAGGTDLVAKMNTVPEKSGWIRNNGEERPLREKHVIFLGNLGLSYITEKDDGIHIGTCTTLSDLLDSPVISEKLPLLKKAVSEIAGITIRNVATLGGNVMNASPAADSIPALMALDCRLVLCSAEGERTVPVEGFFKGPGETEIGRDEILKELIVPVCPGKADFIKFGRRKAETLSIVNGAGRIVTEAGVCTEARLALGAVAETPRRLFAIEEMLVGQTLTAELAERAAAKVPDLISPIDDVRSTASYRSKLARVLVERVLKTACQV